MYEEKDVRFQRTKEAIIAAMVELLEKKSFNQITVKMICDTAAISRSGFYLHYTDKYDLVTSYQKEIMHKGMDVLSKRTVHSRKELMEYMLTLLTNEGRLLALLISDNGAVESQKTMKKLMEENAEKNILPYMEIGTLSPTQKRYFLSFYSHAIFGTIQEWVHSGQQESPRELVAILDQLITFDLKNNE